MNSARHQRLSQAGPMFKSITQFRQSQRDRVAVLHRLENPQASDVPLTPHEYRYRIKRMQLELTLYRQGYAYQKYPVKQARLQRRLERLVPPVPDLGSCTDVSGKIARYYAAVIAEAAESSR